MIEYRVRIGLEIHIPISTVDTKLFCRCPNPAKYRPSRPNEFICPICLGQPGSLPRPNMEAIKKAVKLAYALNMDIPERIQFYRKHYLYPDLPKGYQITQYLAGGDKPIGLDGYFNMIDGKRVTFRRLQLEEDPARLIHPGGLGESNYVLIDYNRSGTPLIELVTDPIFQSAEEARRFLEEILVLLDKLDIYKSGSNVPVRADANVSLEDGARIEIKNLNSPSDLEKALNFEIMRMKKYRDEGVEIKRETRHWDERRKITVPIREKEYEEEYRYFPDPNLPPIYISDIRRDIEDEIPFTISNLLQKLIDEGIRQDYAKILVKEGELLQLYKKISNSLNITDRDIRNFLVGLIVNEGKSLLKRRSVDLGKLERLLTSILSLYIDGIISKEEAKRKLIGIDRKGRYADEQLVKSVVEKVVKTVDRVSRRTRDYIIGRVLEELSREGYVVDAKTILKYIDVKVPRKKTSVREITVVKPESYGDEIRNRIPIKDAFMIRKGKHIITGWIESKMYVGDRIFIVIRDWSGKIQGIVDSTRDAYQKIDSIPREAFIAIHGYLKEDERAPGGVEIDIIDVKMLSEAHNPPLTLLDLSRSSYSVRMKYRFLDLRRRKVRAILSFREKLIKVLREYLVENGFREINTPTIIASASEGGAELFPILYYGREAFLAQSPQLYKQMALNAFEKVFEIDSYYRAQKFDTPRHLTEFWSLDVEAALYSLDDLLKLQEDMLNYSISRLRVEAKDELDILECEIGDIGSIPRITYDEAINMAIDEGIDIEYGEDLSMEAMKAVSERLNWGPHHIILWPRSTRAFYYKVYPDNPDLTLSFDLIIPVNNTPIEVSSGGERINDAETLIQRLRERGLREEAYGWYVDMFKYGMPPHGGFGLGIDRLVMVLLGLNTVLDTLMLPRTPKYFIP